MTVTVTNLITSQAAPVAQTTLYTVPAATVVILDKLTATNTAGAAATVSLNLVNSGGAAGASNLITSVQSIAAGASYQFPEAVGHVLTAGQFVSMIASATTVTLRASGRVVA
jgi:hypothetical protein